MLTNGEMDLLVRTMNTLREVSSYQRSTISEPEFEIIHKLFKWPTAKLFPGKLYKAFLVLYLFYHTSLSSLPLRAHGHYTKAYG